jgi:serine/threonine-protein kinase
MTMDTNLADLRRVLGDLETGQAGPDISAILAAAKLRPHRSAGIALARLAQGQLWQICAGAAIMLAGTAVWSSQLGAMGLLFASGVLLHLFGAVMIASGVMIRMLALRIDLAGPVLETQLRMARVERIAAFEGWVLGMGWCFLWIPAGAALFYLLSGFDLFSLGGSGLWIGCNVTVGVLIIAVLRWVRDMAAESGNVGLAQAIDGALTGQRVRDASAALAEIHTFAA